MIYYTLLGTFRQIVIAHSKLWLQNDPVNNSNRFKNDIAEANSYLKLLLSQMLLV